MTFVFYEVVFNLLQKNFLVHKPGEGKKLKLTLHRALSELKMLDKRIYAAVNEHKYVAYQIGEEKPQGFKDKTEFEESATSGFQSVNDLIIRRNEIKRKLILANAQTFVNVAGVEMTIAEAIDQKDAIGYKQSLLNELRRQLALVNQQIDRENRDMEHRLDKRLDADLGSKDRKNYTKEVEEITENFLKRYRPNVIDPISIREKITKLEKEISSFVVEVDAVLSEINAITTIEIND